MSSDSLPIYTIFATLAHGVVEGILLLALHNITCLENEVVSGNLYFEWSSAKWKLKVAFGMASRGHSPFEQEIDLSLFWIGISKQSISTFQKDTFVVCKTACQLWSGISLQRRVDALFECFLQ